MKKCSKCKKLKSAKDFYKDSNTKTGLASRCKICHCQACSEYRKTEKGKKVNRQGGKKYRNSEKGKQSYRAWRLSNDFGLTVESWQQMFEAQQGRCAICGKHQLEFEKKLAVDHNHVTNKVRGLLCFDCNTGIGMLKADKKHTELLIKSIKYLEVK